MKPLEKLEKYRRQSEMFKKMTPEEHRAYNEKKIAELREATRRAQKFVPNRNKLLDQIVAECPTLDE